LSKGDIAAAARAALEKRKQNTQFAIEDQKKGLELAKELELKKISVDVNGVMMTRAELEDKIRINAEKITKAKAEELEYGIRIGQYAEKLYKEYKPGAGTSTSGGTNTGVNTNVVVTPPKKIPPKKTPPKPPAPGGPTGAVAVEPQMSYYGLGTKFAGLNDNNNGTLITLAQQAMTAANTQKDKMTTAFGSVKPNNQDWEVGKLSTYLAKIPANQTARRTHFKAAYTAWENMQKKGRDL
jgi:hypothetical protein